LEPWEKVLIESGTFTTTIHGQIDCVICHNGVHLDDKESAHEGLISRPSEEPQSVCGECHPDVVSSTDNSLHSNLTGYKTVLETRSIPENHIAIDEMFGNHCGSCHATCGDCHISQPATVGGGFINGHVFNREPSMTRNCTACHGSRVGNEYLGKHEDLRADVHFRQGRMKCVDCHTSHEMHGQLSNCATCHPGPEEAEMLPPDHRYAGVQTPRCESCHTTVAIGDGIEMHEAHGADLSCQVCHSIAYTSCDGCHVEVSETTGNPFFRTEASYLTFFIGRNPLKSFDRPYDYVPLRHVPIATTSFQFYGEDLLPNFDQLPTWVYATPHNIQRETPQTESCDSCHGNSDIFLTSDKVSADELIANQLVIMGVVPSPIESITTTVGITSTVEVQDDTP
jgi:thiosulfate/3-mercaptopyruvate sulfurtransferase